MFGIEQEFFFYDTQSNLPLGMKKNDENQSCSPFNSVQDALSIKFWGPFF